MPEKIEQMDLFAYLNKSDSQFFFLSDIESGVCRWSTNARGIFDIPGRGCDPFRWEEFVHPMDLETFLNSYMDLQRRHIRQFCKEFRFKLVTGGYAWVLCSGRMLFPPESSKAMLSGMVTRLQMNNNFDSVTNLHYISSFRENLAGLSEQSVPYGILLIGLDDFKRLNNLYSYSFGDHVLSDFSTRLDSLLPTGARLFRLDGDSFGILYPNADVATLIDLFNQVQVMAQLPRNLQNISVSFTVSGGICRYPEDGREGDLLYRNGRIAFAESKRRGKKQVTVCSAALCTQVQRRMQLLEMLRESTRDNCNGFSLRFQPLIYAESEQLYGCEVLMRWTDPQTGEVVSPYEFVPILEDSGLIFEVNRWLLRESFLQCAQWVLLMPDFQMNVNISCGQFEDPDFKFLVMHMLHEANLSASAITLELTESSEVSDMDAVNDVFSFLRSQGVKIALDDFGIGYSSLSIFQMLKADELKIDRSFLQRLTYDVTDQALVRQIIELCHSMNMMVCVEGVESDQVTEIVKEFGPEILQGFYYDRPLEKEAFEQKYFHGPAWTGADEQVRQAPEVEQSMVYAALRPTQPMSMDMIINNAHAGIFQVAMDASFSFITCNDGYRKMLGYTARDIEIRFHNNALGIVYPDDMEYVNDEIRRQLGEGDTVTIEFRVVKSDGTPIWILGTGNVVKSIDGGASLLVIIVDNSRLKNAQIETERQFKRYERILSNIPVGVKCVQNNEDFDLDYMSPAFLSLLGYEDKELDTLYNRKYINMVLDEDRPAVISDVLTQVKDSNIVVLRYRAHCKDRTPIWVETISRLCPPEEDGIQRWYSSVINITDKITEDQKSHTQDFANRIHNASTQWGDILFEYDFITGTVSFSDNYVAMFGRQPQRNLLSEIISIYPDDRVRLDDALLQMHEDAQAAPIEVRYYSEKRGYIWISILFTKPNVLGESPVSVMGRISDIDEEKKVRESLLLQSRIDGLTGLLNKKSVEADIRMRIALNEHTDKSFALCVLDIDDFKGINDKYGHIIGDQVLVEIADRLSYLADEQMLVGRAGGDEFLVYAELGKKFPDADAFGKAIIHILCQPMKYEDHIIPILSSAGIALYPQDSTDFYKLFRLADSALYLIKASGKGNYHIATPAASTPMYATV